jgi:tRNA pseudouridine55 synthase
MDGIILVDKPAGPSSAEIVRRIKGQVKPARVGHLGTLDPFATGVLPILVGEGTKLATFLQEGEKEYEGSIALGAETDTLDHSGTVVRAAAVPELEPSRLTEIAERFTGMIEQTPPIYSAIKRAGVPLYKRARRGEEVAPPPSRRIEVKRLELDADGPDAIAHPERTCARSRAISESRLTAPRTWPNCAGLEAEGLTLPTPARSRT